MPEKCFNRKTVGGRIGMNLFKVGHGCLVSMFRGARVQVRSTAVGAVVSTQYLEHYLTTYCDTLLSVQVMVVSLEFGVAHGGMGSGMLSLSLSLSSSGCVLHIRSKCVARHTSLWMRRQTGFPYRR